MPARKRNFHSTVMRIIKLYRVPNFTLQRMQKKNKLWLHRRFVNLCPNAGFKTLLNSEGRTGDKRKGRQKERGRAHLFVPVLQKHGFESRRNLRSSLNSRISSQSYFTKLGAPTFRYTKGFLIQFKICPKVFNKNHHEQPCSWR